MGRSSILHFGSNGELSMIGELGSDLAVLRLDRDLYESTMDALNPLYAKVASGGFIIVADYLAVPQAQLPRVFAPACSPFASLGRMRERRARRRTGGPRDRFKEVLEQTHGGLIVE
jgi:hypothetical protein